jgi:ornithine cyclodeaminase
LIGAYKANMREVDDKTLLRSRIFVDSRDTTIEHIGELKIPLAKGIIRESNIIADFYDENKNYVRKSNEEITLFKNGGGAHLDLMTGKYILDTCS